MAEAAEDLELPVTSEELLPGRQLSRHTIGMIAAAEREFDCYHLETAARAAVKLPRMLADEVMNKANELVGSCYFHYGRIGFDVRCRDYSILPLLTWLCLKELDPKVTFDEAMKLVPKPQDPKQYPFQRLVWKAWGFTWGQEPSKNTPGGKGKQKKSQDKSSTGSGSSTPSSKRTSRKSKSSE